MAATISLKNKTLVSVIGLLCVGHIVARLAKPYENAWIYVCLFYAAWLIASLLLLLGKQDFRNLFALQPLNKNSASTILTCSDMR